jgi:hypothetical protein
MPAIIICTKPDGRILVSAMAEVPPEYEQDALEVASLDEAASLMQDVLGEGEATTGEMQEEPAEQEEVSGAEGMPMESAEDQMAAGFTRAKKGY